MSLRTTVIDSANRVLYLTGPKRLGWNCTDVQRQLYFLTREAHAEHELSCVVDLSVPRSMGCKLYANEVRSELTFKLLSIFN